MEEEASGFAFRQNLSSLRTQASTESKKVTFKLRSQDTGLKTDERSEMICSLLGKPL